MRFIPLFSGSSGNSSLVIAGDVKMLIDAGMAGRAISEALAELKVRPESLSAILVTHDHIDHTRGVGVMSRKYNIPVYANAGTWRIMEPIIKEIPQRNRRVFSSDQDFYIGNVNIEPFRTPHDAEEAVGFTIVHEGHKLLYMTDIGCLRESMAEKAVNTDLAFVEANHDIEMLKYGPYPYRLKQRILSEHGHLSNDDCAKLLIRLYGMGVRTAILAHLSKENNTPELACRTVQTALENNGIDDMSVIVARRDGITGIFDL